MSKFLWFAVFSLSAFFPLKIFWDKMNSEVDELYTQEVKAEETKRSMSLDAISGVSCEGMSSLSTYFYQVADRLSIPRSAIVIIPAESMGNPYATGCDPCGSGGDKRRAQSSEWLRAVFGMGLNRLCLRKATIGDTCSVGFGLMQITSHTLTDMLKRGIVKEHELSPYALYQTKAFSRRIDEEPQASPYNVCTNIKIGLLILREKFQACKNKQGIRKIACAFCYYNGSPKYLKHIRDQIRSRGGASLLARLGFIKDDAIDFLKDFASSIAEFLGFGIDKCKWI